MLTLKKVKELVEAPSHAKRTPSPKMLFEEGIVLLRREFDQGSHLTVYNSGYVLFSAGKRNTVFHIHDCCGDYAYDAAEGKGDVIEEEYFENCEWHIRALFEGERKMEDNQAKCKGAGRSNVCVSYHALSEDWSEIADRTINMLEKIIENEAVHAMLAVLTDKQRDLIHQQFVLGKTAKSILISCGARLAPFDIAELRDLMAYDEMELDLLGDRRTALFVIISDTDDTFNFVVSIMYTQLFNLLCDRADDQCGGQLKYHVRLLLDEFANIGLIPKFDKLIATIRSREISASIILQSQSQLKTIYKDAAETIIGNCDTMLFLGGKESSTLKEISETLGKETIDLYNTSNTRGQSPSFGTTYQKTGKELMSRDELSVMDGSKCILQLRGVRPFLSDKFDITKHKRYKELSDFDKKNAFDVERYLKHELRLRMDEEFDCYEVDLTPATEEVTA